MSYWSRYDPEILKRAQAKLLEKSGVNVTERHVRISESLQLFTLRAGNPGHPVMLIIHGYGGSGLVFFKTLKTLTESYYVITLDLLGMGRSTRPEFAYTSIHESESFFINSIERFRETEDLQKFVLVGHSFGGYISGCYATRHPEYIDRILFLSPIGVPSISDKYNYLNILNNEQWKIRWFMKIVVFFWVKNITPMALVRKTGPLSTLLMRKYLKKYINTMDKEETQSVRDYLQQINLLTESGELALAYILQPGAWAYYPLSRRLKNLNIPMAFFYGDIDWVKPDGTDVIAQTNRTKVLVKMIQNSGHHLYFDNPEALAEEMLAALKELQT